MSHFGRSGPPDIRDTFSLLVLNITFRTTADDLFPLFDKYGKVVDVFIPRDRRTGESRGFAFVRYKYAEEARKAVDRLDGRVVDGREIMVQFAKFGPNAERIQSGRIVESSSKIKGRSRSRSPRPRYRDGYRDKDRDRDYRKRSRSRSRDRYDRDGYRGRDRDYHPRSVSHSPDHRKECGRGHDEKRHRRSQSYARPSLLGSALILQGALLHTGHIVGMEVLMDAMITNAHLMEALILQGALLHSGHIVGMEVLMDAMITNAHLLQRVSHLAMNLLILEPIHMKV
nr:serine/arginine-rich splicing factor SC35-like isoform X3 [Populus alba]